VTRLAAATEVVTADCYDCGVEACAHELDAVRRVGSSPAGMALVCHGRAGCCRRQDDGDAAVLS
jgi:hypothetical protein